MDCNVNCSNAPPANLPRGFASTTVPSTLAPAGMATSPLTSTGFASVPPKLWPCWLSLEPTASARRMVSTLPEGTVTLAGTGGAERAFVIPVSVLPCAPELSLVCAELSLCNWLGLLLHPVTSIAANASAKMRNFIGPPRKNLTELCFRSNPQRYRYLHCEQAANRHL